MIDATHPFAVLVTGNIKRACERTEVRYLRCLREEEHLAEEMGTWYPEQSDSYVDRLVRQILTAGNPGR